jgi:hypothetical protein
MHIEPVFLVAPRHQPAWTRRGFLLAGVSFAGGASLGSACGFAVGARQSAAASPVTAEPTGDAELDQLRRLAASGSDAELVQHRLLFVASTFSHYATDPTLWHGVTRLADLAVGDASFPDRAMFARALAGVIERADTPHASLARQRLVTLRGLR